MLWMRFSTRVPHQCAYEWPASWAKRKSRIFQAREIQRDRKMQWVGRLYEKADQLGFEILRRILENVGYVAVTDLSLQHQRTTRLSASADAVGLEARGSIMQDLDNRSETRTQTTSDRLKEAGNINKSLMVLGQCMEVMRSNQKRLAQSLANPGRTDTRDVKNALLKLLHI
ncbi:hypothetical protein C8R48DRAFT_779919 [Suillus tomentosus]|nr:hypothetical protein C8R48DRAFT_779919 [Suillus tomentosus]